MPPRTAQEAPDPHSPRRTSAQDHYDFGLRSVKAVIVAAGKLKRAQPTTPEAGLTYRAIIDCNLPKVTTADLPIFEGITRDLFPRGSATAAHDASAETGAGARRGSRRPSQPHHDSGSAATAAEAATSEAVAAKATAADASAVEEETPSEQIQVLKDALGVVCEEAGLQLSASFALKCVQLFETLTVRRPQHRALVGHRRPLARAPPLPLPSHPSLPDGDLMRVRFVTGS